MSNSSDFFVKNILLSLMICVVIFMVVMVGMDGGKEKRERIVLQGNLEVFLYDTTIVCNS